MGRSLPTGCRCQSRRRALHSLRLCPSRVLPPRSLHRAKRRPKCAETQARFSSSWHDPKQARRCRNEPHRPQLAGQVARSPAATPMPGQDLSALFLHQLKDTYFAENAILKALPTMMEAAQSADLKVAFGVHQQETEEQVKRLDPV